MQQKERFSVAMLALILKHDLEFRRDFLNQVCGCGETAKPENFEVELEVAGCGDLVLRRKDDCEVYALEFKISAGLQDHNQNPLNEVFFTSGYGAGIKNRYKPDGKARRATYIVIENDPTDLRGAVEKIPHCVGKSWRDIGKCSYDRLLVRDLFESFGLLDIPEFIHMNTKNFSLGHGDATRDAAKLYKLLEAVAGHFGSKTKLDVGWDSEGGSIGMNFVPKTGLDEWRKLVQPTNDTIGWFGYEQYETSTLAVWFYCGNAKAAARVHELLGKRFSEAEVSPPDAQNNVIIHLLADKSADNQDWFISVFESLVQRK